MCHSETVSQTETVRVFHPETWGESLHGDKLHTQSNDAVTPPLFEARCYKIHAPQFSNYALNLITQTHRDPLAPKAKRGTRTSRFTNPSIHAIILTYQGY